MGGLTPPSIGVLWGPQLGSYRGPTPPLLGPYQEGLARPLETCHKGPTLPPFIILFGGPVWSLLGTLYEEPGGA